jgi:hypothetical protein
MGNVSIMLSRGEANAIAQLTWADPKETKKTEERELRLFGRYQEAIDNISGLKLTRFKVMSNDDSCVKE